MALTAQQVNPYLPVHHFTGIGHKLADKIRGHFLCELRGKGDQAEWAESNIDQYIYNQVKADPYILTEVRGVSFERADAIALEDFNIHPKHPSRHYHGNRSVLQSDGVMPEHAFKKKRKDLGLLSPDLVFEGVTLEDGQVWLAEELSAEMTLARWLVENARQAEPLNLPMVEKFLDETSLNREQREFINLALGRPPVMALTGDAGSGKTFTLANFAWAASVIQGREMIILAFAGKAADRAKEALEEVGVDFVRTSTIHRALGILADRVSTVETLPYDIVVIDEASMIPNWLLACVITALKKDAQLILTGDPNQLPPIGYGYPFEVFLEHGIPHAHLTQNYRQKDEQSIFLMAEAIRQGNALPDESKFMLKASLDMADASSEALIHSVIKPNLFDWQVLTWKNDTKEALNVHLQDLCNPQGSKVLEYWIGKGQRSEIRVGDKVMITNNDYDYHVFNGQTAVITNHLVSDQTPHQMKLPCLALDFGNRVLIMAISDAEDLLRLGYAVTVHKSQGSGWESVCLFQSEPVHFNARRFYYTATTRAKKQFLLMTEMSAFDVWMNAIEEERKVPTTLARRIKNLE